MLLNICGWTFVAGPMAIGIAANVRVGTELGAGRPLAARVAALVSYIFGVGWMGVMALILYFRRRELATFMVGGGGGGAAEVAEAGRVVDLVCELALYAALFQVFDGVLGVSGGVLRGCGRQKRVAQVNVVTLWGVGVLGGLVATFGLGCGVFGLWYGLAFGVALGGSATGFMVASLDWKKEADRAADGAALSAKHAAGARSRMGSRVGGKTPPVPMSSPVYFGGGGRTDSFRAALGAALELELPQLEV